MLARLPFSRRTFLLVGLLVMLAAGGAFVARAVYEQQNFITTENASIQGMLVKVASPNTGRVFEFLADVGAVVYRDQAVATIDIPVMDLLPSGGGSRASFLDARDRLARVTSPVDGVVVSRSTASGDSVTPNQTIMTVVDTTNVWVVANVEETRVARVHPGQQVEVYVDALQRTLDGTVESIIPATTSTFSLLPAQNASGNFTKVVQLVPVRIALPQHDGLIVGASVKVRIHLT